MAKFNLIDEPWIPVLRNGTRELASLRSTLLEAHEISGLAPDFPAQAPAVLRQVLLPVALASGIVATTSEQWAQWFAAAGFDAEQAALIEKYLTEHSDRFDLFDARRPFGQVANLAAASGETKSIGQLIAPIAMGNNVPLLTAYTEADTLALSPGEAALWMLHAQCWDTAGIKTGAVGDEQVQAGKTTGNRTGPLGGMGVVVPTGRTLHATIMLNLPVRADGLDPQDSPQWDRDRTAAWSSRPATGLLDLFTWQSRRIRLIPEQVGQSVIVNRVVIAAGDRLPDSLDPNFEPHTLWKRTAATKSEPSVIRPRRHAPGRAAWRGLDSLIAVSLPADGDAVFTSRLLRQLAELTAGACMPTDYPVDVEVYGFTYGTQSSTFEDNVFDVTPLPILALSADADMRDAVLELVDHAKRLEYAVNILADDLRRAAGGDPVPWNKGQRPGVDLVHALDPVARRLLTDLRHAATEEQIDELLLRWEQDADRAAKAVAELLLSHQPPQTFLGRAPDEKHTYRAATAELSFRSSLAKILRRAAEARTST
jgi:CRISPR system Cascade subunit CasA